MTIPSQTTFCSSPWLHLRISHSGDFYPCRWMSGASKNYTPEFNIRNTSVIEYFNSTEMNIVREKILNNEPLPMCSSCYYQDSFDKVSGRAKQLFRSKISIVDTFEDDYQGSPHHAMFEYSQTHDGKTDTTPIDLQIDLENTCNSGCIMCDPVSSSRLAVDFVKLSKISPKLFASVQHRPSWATLPALVEKFAAGITELPNIDYIHFLGGETLFVESFYAICDALIQNGSAQNIILGTTTNGTIFTPRLEHILTKFKSVHLGISVESNLPVNDYIRYPSKVASVMDIIGKFLQIRKNWSELYVQLRITPNIFSMYYLDTLLQFMVDNEVIAESCGILRGPKPLLIELMPDNLRKETIAKLTAFITKNNLEPGYTADIRSRDNWKQVVANMALEYIHFLENMTPPDNVESLRYDLVNFLNSFESLRGNCILDYAPEYTEFLEAYGYKRPLALENNT